MQYLIIFSSGSTINHFGFNLLSVFVLMYKFSQQLFCIDLSVLKKLLMFRSEKKKQSTNGFYRFKELVFHIVMESE